MSLVTAPQYAWCWVIFRRLSQPSVPVTPTASRSPHSSCSLSARYFFVVQGCMTENWPLVIANAITTACSVIIFVIKMRNDYAKKR